MGEKQTKPFQLSFNGLLKFDFQGSHVTSDGGLILVRELADLLRQSVYSRLAGLRGPQRRRPSVGRPDLSLARLEEELGSRRGAHLAATELRDRATRE